METANPHLEKPPIEAGAPLESAEVAAVVVHGRGQEPQFMLDALVDRMGLPGVAYLLPSANGGSWYPERFTEPFEANEPWLSYALAACEDAIKQVHEAGVPIERTVLIGFSQGGCLIADLIARRPRPYGAVAILTGSLIGPDHSATRPAGRLDGVPVLCGSSRYDEWVPIERVKATAAAFREAGAEVEFHAYEDREHIICDGAVDSVRVLLSGISGIESGS